MVEALFLSLCQVTEPRLKRDRVRKLSAPWIRLMISYLSIIVYM